MDPAEIRGLIDRMRRRVASVAAVIGAVSKGRPLVVVGLTNDLIARGLKAGAIVDLAGKAMGGGGGGRPDMAQAGGKDAYKLDEAVRAAAEAIEREIG